MTKDQLLSWAVQNVKVWPARGARVAVSAPAGCSWEDSHEGPLLCKSDPASDSGYAFIGRSEWEAAIVACGLPSGEFQPFVSVEDAPTATAAAANILQQGVDALSNRAAERDQADGERSMARCVKAFNVMFGHQITEEQGWQFMELLKMARAAGGAYREDDYVDGAAYAALAGEAAAKVRGAK